MSVTFISGRTKDSVHLVYKDHRFSRDRTRNDTIYWRCMLSRKTPLNPIICKARISTDKDGNIISVGQSHNHPPNKLEIQIRTCISDIKRLGELHKKDQLDVTDKNLLSKLVENVPARNKLKSDRRKYRSKQQLNEQSIPGKPTQEFNCNLLSIGMPSRTMPTFSLAHLANNDTTHFKIVEPTVEKQKVALPPQLLSPSSFENHLPLRPLINNVISPSTPLIPASKDPTALMFSSLEKELLNLLDVEELSKLLPGFSQNSSQLLKASAPGIDQVASAGLPGSSITRSDSLMSTKNLFKT